MTDTIAILCAANRSVYHSMENVEVYDMARDARTFGGDMPIVAHPPCRAWSVRVKHQAKPAPGEKELGLWCCEQLKACGGVLEQPAFSELFAAGGLPRPGDTGRGGLWSMQIWQAWFGYPMKKNTWLCFAGIPPREVPDIPFRLHPRGRDRRAEQLMSKHQRSATTREFAEWLVSCARIAANRLRQEVLF